MKKSKKTSEKNNTSFQPAAHTPAAIQRKLMVGAENDPLEREADAIADQVIRMPEPGFVQRNCAHCEEEKKEKLQRKPLIQRKVNGNSPQTASPEVASGIAASRGSGRSLDRKTSTEMGSKMGADFSGVNIHTDSRAAQLSQDLGAKAFTVGNDIYFNKDQYNPASGKGKRLMAHELVHVVQQDKSKIFETTKTVLRKPSANIQRETPLEEGTVDLIKYKEATEKYRSGTIKIRFDIQPVFSYKGDLFYKGKYLGNTIYLTDPGIRSKTEIYIQEKHYSNFKPLEIKGSSNIKTKLKYFIADMNNELSNLRKEYIKKNNIDPKKSPTIELKMFHTKKRTVEKQVESIIKGHSWTCRSAHMNAKAGHARLLIDGKYSRQPRKELTDHFSGKLYKKFVKKWTKHMKDHGLKNYKGEDGWAPNDAYHLEMPDGRPNKTDPIVKECIEKYVEKTRNAEKPKNKKFEKQNYYKDMIKNAIKKNKKK